MTAPELTAKHPFFSLSKETEEISVPLLKYLGISYFTFNRTFTDGAKIYLFNNPYYYEHYFSKKYYQVGNRAGPANMYSSSYDLWDYLPDPHNLYNEASNFFNISHGLTITRKHENHSDFFFFATNRDNPLVKKLYLNRREILENFCDFFLESGKELISTAEKSKVVLPYTPDILYTTKEFEINKFMKEISVYKNELASLTKRELDCVLYLVQGKANKEIADKLNISVRTVEEYVASIKHKMGCKNKSELIALLCKFPVGVFPTS